MTTIRLTTADHRDVTKRAVDTAFKTKEAELVREEHNICRAAWELVLPERERVEAAVGALVRRATTLKRLGEIWPEGAPHYAHLAARAQHPVPAVQVDTVNAMLGLPEPGTAP